MYENHRYLIFPVTEMGKVNFAEVFEDSAESLRYSVDKTKTFVNWDNSSKTPEFVDYINNSYFYTYDEILQILATPEWTVSLPEAEV